MNFRNCFKSGLVVLATGVSSAAFAKIEIGKILPTVELNNDDGGKVTGGNWSSQELKRKNVTVLFYIDPDERELNEHVYPILRFHNFPQDKFSSVAIINMAASWLPNYLIASELQKKQKEYPNTVYVKDFRKLLIKTWEVADDNSDVLLINKEQKVLFYKEGKLSNPETENLVKLIKENL